MPGRPKLQAFKREIEGEDGGGIDMVCERIMAGVTIAQVVRDLGVSEGLFYAWLKTDDEYWPMIREARAIAAHKLVDEAMTIADGSKPKDASVTRERVKMRQWLAERYNREAYGQPEKQAPVQVNIGQLYMTAMKRAREIEEAEVIEVLPKNTSQDQDEGFSDTNEKSGEPEGPPRELPVAPIEDGNVEVDAPVEDDRCEAHNAHQEQ